MPDLTGLVVVLVILSFLGLAALLVVVLCQITGFAIRYLISWLRNSYLHLKHARQWARHARQMALQAHSVKIEVTDGGGYQVVE